MRTLGEHVRSALGFQVGWALLAALWNVAGVYLIGQGKRAIGPTASLAAAGMMLVFAAAFPFMVSRWPIVYALLSAIAGLMALAAVVNAFRADRALWPSEFWRYAGVALNGIGTLAAAFAAYAIVRYQFGR